MSKISQYFSWLPDGFFPRDLQFDSAELKRRKKIWINILIFGLIPVPFVAVLFFKCNAYLSFAFTLLHFAVIFSSILVERKSKDRSTNSGLWTSKLIHFPLWDYFSE